MKNKEPAQVHTENQVRVLCMSEGQRQEETVLCSETWQALSVYFHI